MNALCLVVKRIMDGLHVARQDLGKDRALQYGKHDLYRIKTAWAELYDCRIEPVCSFYLIVALAVT